MPDRQVGPTEPNRDIFLSEAAVPEDGGMTLGKRNFNCHPVLEPVPEYIDEVIIFRKKGRQRLHVVAIPRINERVDNRSDSRLVLGRHFLLARRQLDPINDVTFPTGQESVLDQLQKGEAWSPRPTI